MKTKKGNAGYITARKKQTFIKTVLQFGIVVAILLLGIAQTGDRMNVLTVVAVLGCLPASKALVEFIMILPHTAISKEKVAEIEEKARHLTTVYDMVFTSEKKSMRVPCIAIGNDAVCGYTTNPGEDIPFIEKHLKQYANIDVKIYDKYDMFLKQAEEMSAEVQEDAKKGEDIRRILLNISL